MRSVLSTLCSYSTQWVVTTICPRYLTIVRLNFSRPSSKLWVSIFTWMNWHGFHSSHAAKQQAIRIFHKMQQLLGNCLDTEQGEELKNGLIHIITLKSPFPWRRLQMVSCNQMAYLVYLYFKLISLHTCIPPRISILKLYYYDIFSLVSSNNSRLKSRIALESAT